MAFQTGTRVDPRLGALDFSGFTNAANIQAQGMMNLGESIGEGIEKYQKNKQITAKGLAELEVFGVTYPKVLTSLKESGGEVAKALEAIESGDYKQRDVLTVNGAAKIAVSNALEAQTAKLNEIKLEEAEVKQADRQRDSNAFDSALIASRKAGGGVDVGALSNAYFEQGGRDSNDLKIIESMQKLDGPNIEVIEIDGFKVVTQDGRYMTASRDGQDASNAAIDTINYKLEQRKKARKLYEEGNISEANDILAANGYKGLIGSLTAEEAFGTINNNKFDPEKLSAEDKKAYDFAINNPNAPQSETILRFLGAN